MNPADSDLVRGLLSGRRVLALSVLVDGRPFVGQLPFAARPDFGALLIHASRLARHSRGLRDGAPFSALIQAPDTGSIDPFQIPRLATRGTVRQLARGSEEYETAKAAYLDRLPTGQITFSLGDFVLYELVIEKARLVAGFGRTANLTPGALEALARDDADGQESGTAAAPEERT